MIFATHLHRVKQFFMQQCKEKLMSKNSLLELTNSKTDWNLRNKVEA